MLRRWSWNAVKAAHTPLERHAPAPLPDTDRPLPAAARHPFLALCRAQVRVTLRDGDDVAMLGGIMRPFPNATSLEFDIGGLLGASKLAHLAARLPLLPSGCWQAAARTVGGAGLPLSAVCQLPRLCPHLQEVAVGNARGYASAEQLEEVLESLVAVEGTLETLRLTVSSDHAAAASRVLPRLRGLRRLGLRWVGGGDLLPGALPRLTALSVLAVECGPGPEVPRLGPCPASLRC